VRPDADGGVRHPEWSRRAVLYQIHTRQLTPEGTLDAARPHLGRLRDLGVDVLWLVPIHEIGRERRKGTLGSPYAVRDHLGVAAELGGRAAFDRFLRDAHAQGFRVILDWVANHTAPDHVLAREHPECYRRDAAGRFHPPAWCDWDDVIDLDYDCPATREYMSRAMRHWVEDAGVDGFRCDVAGFVPLDFWEGVRAELERIRPVFLLAEWESRDLHRRAFDATYGWSWYDAVRTAVRGGPLAPLREFYAATAKAYPPDSLRMTFVSNHDKNAWEGTQFEQFGEGLEAAIVLSMLGDGIPLVYNGQEAGNPRRLAFFERDPIAWREHPVGALYRELAALRRRHVALGNGAAGGAMVPVARGAPERVFAFARRLGGSAVAGLLNFSGETVRVHVRGDEAPGVWRDAFGGERFGPDGFEAELSPWGYRVLEGAG